MARKPPWVIPFPVDADLLARALVHVVGGNAGEAHAAVKRAVDGKVAPHDRHVLDFQMLLLFAAAIRASGARSDRNALLQVAKMRCRNEDDAVLLLRQLQRFKQPGQTLAEFAAAQPYECACGPRGSFTFKLRQ